VSPDYPWGQDKYAAEPLVVLHNDKVYRMKADATGVLEQTIAARIQSESGLIGGLIVCRYMNLLDIDCSPGSLSGLQA